MLYSKLDRALRHLCRVIVIPENANRKTRIWSYAPRVRPTRQTDVLRKELPLAPQVNLFVNVKTYKNPKSSRFLKPLSKPRQK